MRSTLSCLVSASAITSHVRACSCMCARSLCRMHMCASHVACGIYMLTDVLLRDLHQIRIKLQAFSAQVQQPKRATDDVLGDVDMPPSTSTSTSTSASHPADIDFHFTVPTLHLYLAQQPAHGEMRRLIEVRDACVAWLCTCMHAFARGALVQHVVHACCLCIDVCMYMSTHVICRSNSARSTLVSHAHTHRQQPPSLSATCRCWTVVRHMQSSDMC